MSTNELLPSISIAGFLNTREGLRQRLATIHALIEETDTMAQQAGFGRVLQDVAFEHVGRLIPKSPGGHVRLPVLPHGGPQEGHRPPHVQEPGPGGWAEQDRGSARPGGLTGAAA